MFRLSFCLYVSVGFVVEHLLLCILYHLVWIVVLLRERDRTKMEATDGGGGGGSGSSSGAYDKSRVLDVKPLRSLAPVFPSPPLGSQTSTQPFVCAPPFGPFPPGYTPFYPFYNPAAPQGPCEEQIPDTPLPQAVPMAFPTPPPRQPLFAESAGASKRAYSNHHVAEDTGGSNMSVDDGWSDDRRYHPAVETIMNNGDKQKSNSQKRIRKTDEAKFMAPSDGDSESVASIRMKFDALRRRLSQIEDARVTNSGSKRPDLKAGNIMMTSGLRTNTRRRIGSVSGVEIGDIFFFRIEMCLVGLHAPSMAGIDYMNIKFDQEDETIAVSIVSSGGYEDDVDDTDVLIYSGQGGKAAKKEGKEVADQKLERGNLALERSLRRGNDVRVIRGVKDIGNPTGKVYIYDGLYKIQESWMEMGKSGCNVFKYKLVRIPGQPEAFATWKSVERWKEITTSRPGLILPDLTSGAEKLPVSLVNDIDDDKGPAHFTYIPGLQYSKPISSMKPSLGCKCKGGCTSGDPKCSCVDKNGGFLPHTVNGVLVSRKPLIHECGRSCLCHPNCSKNQVSQNGLRVRLEVFKTKERGWGLRSWDPIRAGGFICEYAGQVIDKAKLEQVGDEFEDDEYIFDTTCTFDTSFQWNYIPELLLEEKSIDSNEAFVPPIPLIISAKNVGNVARFMNHSCSPNVFWQPVLHDHNDESYPHIMFYAMKHIPPMTELTYDYGIGGIRSRNAHGGRKNCLCGSWNCRGYMG